MNPPFHRFFDGTEAPEDTVSLADFVEVPASDDEVPEASQWVWCCVSARYGNQVWQHSQIENHPDGLRFRAAGPLRPNDAGIRIFSGGTEIRLKKTGLVSNQALVLGAAPSCVAPQHPSTGSQPASRGRSYTDSNTLDPSIPISDDTLVDQRCPRFPRDIYVRMARSGAFPATKIGKRWVARYGDVKRAFESYGSLPRQAARLAPAREESPASVSDGLDGLRKIIGFDPKGK